MNLACIDVVERDDASYEAPPRLLFWRRWGLQIVGLVDISGWIMLIRAHDQHRGVFQIPCPLGAVTFRALPPSVIRQLSNKRNGPTIRLAV